MDTTLGQVVKTTTTREVVPANSSKERSTPVGKGYPKTSPAQVESEPPLYVGIWSASTA